MGIALWRCAFVCVVSVFGGKIKRDFVNIVHPCIPTIHNNPQYERDQKPLCKHPSLLCNSTSLKHISMFPPSFVAASHDVFSFLLLREKNDTKKKR